MDEIELLRCLDCPSKVLYLVNDDTEEVEPCVLHDETCPWLAEWEKRHPVAA